MTQLALKFKPRYKHRGEYKAVCEAFIKILPDGYRPMLSWGPEDNKNLIVLRTYPTREVAVSTMRKIAVSLKLAYTKVEVIHAKGV